MLKKRGWGVGGATARVRTPMQFGFAFDFRFAFASLTSSIAGNGKWQMVYGNSGHKLNGSTAIYIKFPAPLTADVTPYQAQLKPTSHRSFISKPSISAKTT